MEDYPETIRLHRRLIATRPNGALARYHLGFALGMVGHRGEEIRQYLAAARLGLNQWDLFLNLGLAYLDQGKLEKAVDALETAARLGPDRVEAHFNLAIAYERSGRLRQALKEISQSLRLSPGDPDARDVRAIIAAELQDYGRAPVESAGLVRTEPSHMPAR